MERTSCSEMSFECGICLTEVPKRKRVACTRCVNAVCLDCFRTIATSAQKVDVDCPYCKMVFSEGHVKSMLTSAQITTRRVNVRVALDCDYIQVTHSHINDMTDLCGLMESLHNVHRQIAHVRMKLFPFTFIRAPEVQPSRTENGMVNRSTNDLEQLRLRLTCLSNHIARIMNKSHLPDLLVEDCVSNAFELCSETIDLSMYAPDVQELVGIGLLLCNRHVVRPNAFQYAMLRIGQMRTSQTIETWMRKLTSQCRKSMRIVDVYTKMRTAMQRDVIDANHSKPLVMMHVVQCIEQLAHKPNVIKEFIPWLALFRQWRAARFCD